MAVQSQAHRSVHALTSQLYIKKAPIYMLYRSKAPKTPKFAITDMQEKPADRFYCTTRASTVAPAIILPTWVLL